MIKIDKENINTPEYWANRFENNWIEKLGEEQTKFFMQLIIDNLPDEIKQDIIDNKLSICDCGMALGSGTELLTNTFTDSKIFGVDFVDIAINKAKELHPNCDFKDAIDREVDVLINSNSLEHAIDYILDMNDDVENINKYYIILVPFKEDAENTVSEHVNVFDSIDDFPEEINEFKRVFTKEIDTTESSYWGGSQLLCIYKKQVIEIKESIKNIKPNKTKPKGKKK